MSKASEWTLDKITIDIKKYGPTEYMAAVLQHPGFGCAGATQEEAVEGAVRKFMEWWHSRNSSSYQLAVGVDHGMTIQWPPPEPEGDNDRDSRS